MRLEVVSLLATWPAHAVLGIVLAMLDRRYTDAIALATPTARWELAYMNIAWLDAPDVSDRIRAEHALGRNV